MRNTFAAVFLIHAERLILYRARWSAHCVVARIAGRSPSEEAARQLARDCGLGGVPGTMGSA